jgi:hypothetical protein
VRTRLEVSSEFPAIRRPDFERMLRAVWRAPKFDLGFAKPTGTDLELGPSRADELKSRRRKSNVHAGVSMMRRAVVDVGAGLVRVEKTERPIARFTGRDFEVAEPDGVVFAVLTLSLARPNAANNCGRSIFKANCLAHI